MSWFQLDAESTAARVRAQGPPVRIPGLLQSFIHGIAGFTLLSVAGFAPWAIAGKWLYQHIGETGLYVVCAAVFIGLSGPLLHGLVIGPGSLGRFYKLFAPAFSAYSVLWITGWMLLRGHPGSVAGLLGGTVAMGWILARTFGAEETIKIIAALFVLNSLGYFIGGVVEGSVIGMKSLAFFGDPMSKRSQAVTAKLLWGVCYGAGFGAGLGLAFYLCQARVRAWVISSGMNSVQPPAC
ncbi:MAG TPA: hypothetical protein VHH73_19825 [Verrucomicrobiae bacterium]|nr:hypothetical protein [Verrucomicrobiae bacterium]